MSSYSFKWIVQRITAAILIPLTFWFVYNCVLFSKLDYQSLIIFFNSYLNSSLFLIMMISMLIHTILGCETIIEDYVVSKKTKTITLFILQITIYLVILITMRCILRLEEYVAN